MHKLLLTKKKEAVDEANLEHKCKNINNNINEYPTCYCRQEKLTENYNKKLKEYNECKKKWIGSTCILPTPPTPLPAINHENQTKLPTVECGFLGRVENVKYK